MGKLRVGAFFVISALLIGGMCAAVFYRSGLFVVQDMEIELERGQDLSKDLANEIKSRLFEKAAEVPHQLIWRVDLRRLQESLNSSDWVESAHVSRAYPNHLRAQLQLKRPVYVVATAQGNLAPIAMDASVLSPVAASLLPSLPVLRGESFIREKQLRQRAIDFLHEMPTNGYLAASNIAEVAYSADEGFSLFLVSPRVEVKLGDRQFQLKANHVAQVIDYLQVNKLRGRVIDASFAKKVLVRLRKDP